MTKVLDGEASSKGLHETMKSRKPEFEVLINASDHENPKPKMKR